MSRLWRIELLHNEQIGDSFLVMAEVRHRESSPPVFIDLEKSHDDLPPKADKNPKKAILFSLLLPGLGQWYNAQVLKSILVFCLFFIFTGGSVFYVSLQLVFMLFEFILLGFSLLWETASKPCSDPTAADSLYCTIASYSQAAGTFSKSTASDAMTRITFPAPPLTSTLLRVCNAFLDNFFIALGILLVFIGVYCWQIYDAYSTSRNINNGKTVILRSRKKQVVQIITVNFLPYVLLLLPIPYISTIVAVVFSSSDTITDLIDHVGRKKHQQNNKQSHTSPKTIIWRQLKGLVVNQLYDFLFYSVIILFVLVYVIWYLVLIVMWAWPN